MEKGESMPQRPSSAGSEDASQIDFWEAIERLHHLELPKIVHKYQTDGRWAYVSHADGSQTKISVVQFIKGLPLHIMACLLARQPSPTGKSCFQHAANGLRLLSILHEVCSNVPRQRDDGIVGPDANFTAQLIDMVNVAMLAVAGPEADATIAAASNPATFHDAMHRGALVSTSIRVLGLIVSAQSPSTVGSTKREKQLNWPAVSEAVFSHPRGAVLLDAVFEAMRVLVRAVRAAMLGPATNIFDLAYHPGSGMELLTMWCSTPLFHHRLLLHDRQGAGPLRLIAAALSMHDAPLAPPPFCRDGSGLISTERPYPTEKGDGAAELLAARGIALLLVLGETTNFLDIIAENPETKSISQNMLVFRILIYTQSVLLRPSLTTSEPPLGEAQMGINVLRSAELLSDDHNFRETLARHLAITLSILLRHESVDFDSMWCGGEGAVTLMAGKGQDEILVNSLTEQALKSVEDYRKASVEFYLSAVAGGGKVVGLSKSQQTLGRRLALERTILLAKLFVNLHHYDEKTQTLPPDTFLNILVHQLSEAVYNGEADAYSLAVANLENLFSVAANFGGESPLGDILLMSDLDMHLSRDLLRKIKDAVQQASVPVYSNNQGFQPYVPPAPRPVPQQNQQQQQKQQQQKQIPKQVPQQQMAPQARPQMMLPPNSRGSSPAVGTHAQQNPKAQPKAAPPRPSYAGYNQTRPQPTTSPGLETSPTGSKRKSLSPTTAKGSGAVKKEEDMDTK